MKIALLILLSTILVGCGTTSSTSTDSVEISSESNEVALLKLADNEATLSSSSSKDTSDDISAVKVNGKFLINKSHYDSLGAITVDGVTYENGYAFTGTFYMDQESYDINHYYNSEFNTEPYTYQSYDEYVTNNVVTYTETYEDTWSSTSGSYSAVVKKEDVVISSYSGSYDENGNSFTNVTPTYTNYGTSTTTYNESDNTVTFTSDMTVDYKTDGVTYASLRFTNASEVIDTSTYETISIDYPMTVTITLDDGVKIYTGELEISLDYSEVYGDIYTEGVKVARLVFDTENDMAISIFMYDENGTLSETELTNN
jgi:hypothetical protein